MISRFNWPVQVYLDIQVYLACPVSPGYPGLLISFSYPRLTLISRFTWPAQAYLPIQDLPGQPKLTWRRSAAGLPGDGPIQEKGWPEVRRVHQVKGGIRLVYKNQGSIIKKVNDIVAAYLLLLATVSYKYILD